MTEADWLTCADPKPMLHSLELGASERKLRLFAVACCRCSRPLLRNRLLTDALDVAARYADGDATDDELSTAYRTSNGLAIGPLYHCETERQIHRWAEAVAVANATVVVHLNYFMAHYAVDAAWNIHRAAHRNPNRRLAALVRDIFGNVFRPEPLSPAWLDWQNRLIPKLAEAIYEEDAFDRLPILADALLDAGCDNENVLAHCREAGPHVRGCWVVDLILGKA